MGHNHFFRDASAETLTVTATIGILQMLSIYDSIMLNR